MSRVLSAVVLLLAAAMPMGAHAEVYKCTGPDGRKVYKDLPCDKGQKSDVFDPSTTNLTTIDSEASGREAQEALVTRQAGRQAREAARQDQEEPAGYEPSYVPVYQAEPVYFPYPVYYGGYDDHYGHHHDSPHIPQRPDATPMMPPARGGGGYVPRPPTIREVAPRPPASPRGRTSASRDDDRRRQIP